jgi:hypothetical protein
MYVTTSPRHCEAKRSNFPFSLHFCSNRLFFLHFGSLGAIRYKTGVYNEPLFSSIFYIIS